MVTIGLLDVGGTPVQTLSIQVPSGEDHPNMLMMQCKKGYIMCGYLNIDTAESEGDVAVIISGDDFENLLVNPVKALTPKAKALGIELGMTGTQAIEILNK